MTYAEEARKAEYYERLRAELKKQAELIRRAAQLLRFPAIPADDLSRWLRKDEKVSDRFLVPNHETIDHAKKIPKEDFRIAIETLCTAAKLLVGARNLVGQIHDMENCPEEVRTVIDDFLKDSEGFADPKDLTPWKRKSQ